MFGHFTTLCMKGLKKEAHQPNHSLDENNSERKYIPVIRLIIFLDQVKNPVLEFFFKNFAKKETPPQVFSCKYCEIFKNSLLTTAFFKNSGDFQGKLAFQ